MAKFTYTDNGILFSNLSNDGLKPYQSGHYNGNNDYEYAQEDGVEPFVNAVDIDWNGAVLKIA